MVQDLRRYFGHEILHLILAKCHSPISRTRDEAFTCGLEQRLYGFRSSADVLFNLDKYPWSLQHLHSDDGLAEPDFSSFRYMPNTRDNISALRGLDPLYMAIAVTLQHVSQESLWHISTILMEKAEEQQRHPLMADVHDAIRVVLQDSADEVLRSPVFQTMTKGGNCFTSFQTQDKDALVIYPVHRECNPHHGLQEDGSWEYTSFDLTPQPQAGHRIVRYFDRKDRAIPFSRIRGEKEGEWGEVSRYTQIIASVRAKYRKLAAQLGPHVRLIFDDGRCFDLYDGGEQKVKRRKAGMGGKGQSNKMEE
jgi:hypothetical protein